MPQLTKDKLLRRLYDVYGVENLNALATALRWDPKKVRNAFTGPRGPYFDTTVDLLERAGWLKSEPDDEAAALARERAARRHLEEAAEDAQAAAAELRARSGEQEPPQSAGRRG